MNEELRNEKWSWGDRYLKYRAETTPCSSILDFKSATQILTENSTKKWIEMENDWSRASTKFRRQINTVDDEIKKKRNVRGVDGISNTVHPRSTMNFKLAI